ncbi:metallopeptidase TldD-related protein [Streptomyces sp. MI02-7b]|uniref:metallopeptidase TldD-related protein n=1 Tax=Streptomyces sp. MI02-7b TaxID=462941 RepID=UPI0029B82BAF|nr:metallopeptidase TldD-related protein [Streptomyces sp. MI02-7b]MDX3075932.1 metallopeptidase TldD-related protein [Streptomyces sp. MI02-7b]
MSALESTADHALSITDEVERSLRPNERSHTFLGRTARRQLSVDGDGRKRLIGRRGSWGGYVHLATDEHELYLSAPALAVGDVAALVDTGRALLHLGGRQPSRVAAGLPDPDAADLGEWWNTERTLGLAELSEDPSRIVDPIHEAAGSGVELRSVHITEVLGESVYARSGLARGRSGCRGVEIQAVAALPGGRTATALARYAASLEDIDLAAMGHELALAVVGATSVREADSPARPFDGDRVVFTPNAAAQLLSHVTAMLLITPIARSLPLHTALVDDGRASDGWAARGFDCEGTPTSLMELVTRDGVQQPMVTRLHSLASSAEESAAKRLTGHALWDGMNNCPILSATNVRLEPCGDTGDTRAGEHCVVVDVRSLGVEELRSGGHLAFRLLMVRVVDGRPYETLAPLSVEGEAIDFLAAILAAGAPVSYSPGPFATAGATLVMDLSCLPSRK